MTTLSDVPMNQRPSSASAWRYLLETATDHTWTLITGADGAFAVRFSDGEDIPLSDMAYNSDIGLFRRSQFPDERDDA